MRYLMPVAIATILGALPAAAQTRTVVPQPKLTAPPTRFATPPKPTIVPRPSAPSFQPQLAPRGGSFISDQGGGFRR